MALVDSQAVVAADRAEDAQVGVILDRLPKLAFLPRRADLVEDHAGEFDLGIEILIAEQQRGDTARHADRVNDEHHRRAQQFRQGGDESPPRGSTPS